MKKPALPKSTSRKPLRVSTGELIAASYFHSEAQLPLLVKPTIEGVSLSHWVSNHLDFIKEHLSRVGGILFRDFNLETAGDFRKIVELTSNVMLKYTHRSTPRTEVGDGLYTSTEYPADQSIPLHNEMAYTNEWPMKIWFFCLQPSDQGGETPIADSRRILALIDPRIRERFIEKKVMYVRNYSSGIDLSWETVFQTADRLEVERYCRRVGMEFEWQGDRGLRTKQVCQAIACHPLTGERVWFNQAHLFHISSLEPKLQEYLLSQFQEEYLPRNTYYGDGSPIESSILDEIREVYKQEATVFAWQKGDMLMLDNMLACHGRNPYQGNRKILVAMADMFSAGNIC
jgi:alpha-ketoglutarate-dependent taurine dioxygenase